MMSRVLFACQAQELELSGASCSDNYHLIGEPCEFIVSPLKIPPNAETVKLMFAKRQQ